MMYHVCIFHLLIITIICFNIIELNDHDYMIFNDYDHPSIVVIMKMV
jgi:hypothetical protein